MEELKPEEVATQEPKIEEAATAPPRPVGIARPVHHLTAMEKTVGVLRAILPIAQKFLPLLDGQVGTVVSNLIGPQNSPRQVANALLPLHEGLAQLEKQHIELRAQVAGQNAALRQIEEQIETVRNLAEETAAEQEELAGILSKMRRRVNLFAVAGLVLLAAVVTLNVLLLVHIRRVLPRSRCGRGVKPLHSDHLLAGCLVIWDERKSIFGCSEAQKTVTLDCFSFHQYIFNLYEHHVTKSCSPLRTL